MFTRAQWCNAQILYVCVASSRVPSRRKLLLRVTYMRYVCIRKSDNSTKPRPSSARTVHTQYAVWTKVHKQATNILICWKKLATVTNEDNNLTALINFWICAKRTNKQTPSTNSNNNKSETQASASSNVQCSFHIYIYLSIQYSVVILILVIYFWVNLSVFTVCGKSEWWWWCVRAVHMQYFAPFDTDNTRTSNVVWIELLRLTEHNFREWKGAHRESYFPPKCESFSNTLLCW